MRRYHIRASQAKISRLETGRARCKERDVLDLLALYGVRDAEVVAGLTGATYVDKPDAVDGHRDVMNRLASAALAPAETAGFLAGMLREM